MTFKLQQYYLFILVLILGCSFTVKGQTQNGASLLFDESIAGDATPLLLETLKNLDNENIKVLKFKKGIYHFYPDKALERYTQVANHNSSVVKTAFPIFDRHDLTIDGQGSTFIFHGLIIPFSIENSSNIRIKNVSIDWAMSFHSEGIIVANNLEQKTFDMKISKDYPYEIRKGQLVFIKEYYEHSIGQSILFDPETRATAFNTEAYTSLTTKSKTATQSNVDAIKYKYPVDLRSPEYAKIGIEDKLIAEQLEPGLIRIYGHTKKIPEVGKVVVMKGEQGYNRFAPAFHITFSSDVSFNNIDVHHACGMGLIAENTKNISLDNFNVTPSQGRIISTTADATHFVGCSGKIEIKNCLFSSQLDDAVNVHGIYQQITEILGDHKVAIKVGHFQQQGFTIGKQNDKIGIVNLQKSFFAMEEMTLKAVEKINGRYQVISFNEVLPRSLKVGDYIENLDAYPELLVQNCRIINNRARGLLLSTPRKIVIENSFFSTEMEAILAPVESGYWYESGSVLDLTIRNNIFQDCAAGGQNKGVIRFETDNESDHIAFENILISNNVFNQFDNLIVEANNVNMLEFVGNTINDSKNHESLYPDNPAIMVNHSRNLLFKNNQFSGKATEILRKDKMSSNIILK